MVSHIRWLAVTSVGWLCGYPSQEWPMVDKAMSKLNNSHEMHEKLRDCPDAWLRSKLNTCIQKRSINGLFSTPNPPTHPGFRPPRALSTSFCLGTSWKG